MKKNEMIDVFIQSELSAIESGEGDSDWFCMNGHRLKKDVVAAAPAYLAKEPLIQFYSLLLRRGLFFEEPIKNHYPEWEAAYRVHTPWMVKRPYGWASSIDRLIGLCIFGFDQTVEVGKNDGYQDYCLYLQAMKIHGSNMPDILKRADRLLSFAGEEKVIKDGVQNSLPK